jgi:hypothetical protein
MTDRSITADEAAARLHEWAEWRLSKADRPIEAKLAVAVLADREALKAMVVERELQDEQDEEWCAQRDEIEALKALLADALPWVERAAVGANDAQIEEKRAIIARIEQAIGKKDEAK